MIRLIASDMDGTLLDDEKRLPPSFFSLLQRLGQKGIRFVVASGRSFPILKEQFASYLDEICFICDNGACLAENGVITQANVIPPALVSQVLTACASQQGMIPILCGIHGAYMLARNRQEVREIEQYYPNRCFLSDWGQLQDDIVKITIYDAGDASKNTYPVLAPLFEKQLHAAVSGLHWVDMTNLAVNKGAALRRLQQRLGITAAETMAFGDFYNDVELLQNAGYSYVMANANQDMRRYARYIAPSNQEHGVVKVIEYQIFQQGAKNPVRFSPYYSA